MSTGNRIARRIAYDTAGNVTDLYSGITPSRGGCDNQTSATRWQRSYNPDGTVDEIIDSNAVATGFGYDGDGNLTSVDNPAPAGDEIFTYDAQSRVSTHTDGRGETTGYGYDDVDRIVRITYNGDTGCTSPATCVTFDYDDDGNLVSRIQPSLPLVPGRAGTLTHDYRRHGTTTFSRRSTPPPARS